MKDLPSFLKPDQVAELAFLEGLIFSLGIVFMLFAIAAFIARGRVLCRVACEQCHHFNPACFLKGLWDTPCKYLFTKDAL